MTIERHEDEPVDELGRVANEMIETLHGSEVPGRCVIFLENDQRCMTALDGWESDMEAVAAVIAHLAAVFEANGKKLMIVPLGEGMMLQGIATGALVGAMGASFLVGRRSIMFWRMSLRREKILLEGFQTLNETLADNVSKYDVAVELSAVAVKLADEMNNQARHERGIWIRVPKVGEEWPDFQPAEVTFVEVGDG